MRLCGEIDDKVMLRIWHDVFDAAVWPKNRAATLFVFSVRGITLLLNKSTVIEFDTIVMQPNFFVNYLMSQRLQKIFRFVRTN
jgi:hypothetical protein